MLDALDKLEIAENTLVIYTSDNGSYMYRQDDSGAEDHVSNASIQAYNANNHRANGPLEEQRRTSGSGTSGCHSLPGGRRGLKLEPNVRKTICHVDFFATAADVAGKPLPSPKLAAPDSFSWAPLFLGKNKQFKRAPVIHHSGSGLFALRDGDWKLVFGNGSGGRQKPKGKRFELPFSLFNLADDLEETNDLSTAEPQRLQQMQAKLLKILADERSR